MELSKLVIKIQGGEAERIQELYERFSPLIFTWLKRTGELHGNNKKEESFQLKMSSVFHNTNCNLVRGSGMAVMFIITGILGFTTCIMWYKNKQIQKIQK